MDPLGYFLIRINRKTQVIELGYCRKDNIIEIIVTGKTPQEIYVTAIKEGLLLRIDHTAYLGKELQKAYLTIKYNLNYVQDSELNF